MPALLNQRSALAVAFFSTGSVTKLNRVVMANSAIPTHNKAGKVDTVMIPISNIHVTQREEALTTGTKAERIFKGRYPLACCSACPVSWAATAAAATLLLLYTGSLRLMVLLTGL